jgi:apolipoprotein D and lipocalin family protein
MFQLSVFCLALVSFLATGNVSAISETVSLSKINPDTVKTLDVPKYLGLWYQMAADQIVYSTFEKDAFCCTALYGDNGDGTLSVHNYATIGAANGTTYLIDGYAYQTKADTFPGQLKVVFESTSAAPPFPAPYWVLELGPVNANGLYDWAIVSDNLSTFLFVLARDVNTFNSKYKAQIKVELNKLGFTGRTAPIDTYHGADCVYESDVRMAQMKKFETSETKKI